MNLYDKSSLILVPSGVKASKVYSQRPENGDGDFTFSRSTAATRVNANGLIEKGRENLFTNSNNLTDVTLDKLTRTTGHADPFGGSDAALFTENTGTGVHRFYIYTPATDAVYTYSVYAKPNGRNRFEIVADGQGARAQFNIADGTLINDSNEIVSNIESAGNGWYRISLTYYGAGWIGGYLWNDSGSREYTGDGSSGVYLYGAQVEQGLVATDYIESGSTTGKAGVLEDLPRLDYSGGASCPTLLMEPQTTNYVPYSEKLDSNSISGGTYYANQEISPDGTRNAYGIDLDSTGNRIQPNIGAYDGLVTMSMYIKPVANMRSRLNIYNAVDQSVHGGFFDWNGSTFDITSDGVGYTDAGYENAGNGWYRLWIVGTSISGGNTLAQFRPNVDSDLSERLYVWGLQAERLPYPTSYIPTYGAATTRLFDGSLNNTNFSDIFGSSSLTQYSIFLDIKDGDDSVSTETLISKGSNAQGRINILGGDRICYYSVATGYTTGNNYTDGFPHKYLLVADNGTIKQYFDGSLISTDTNTSDEFTAFHIGGSKSMRLSQYIIFPTSLTNTEAIALTTL